MLCTLLLLFSDLGVHVDGFIANVAHTFVVGVAQVGGPALNSVQPVGKGDGVLLLVSYPQSLTLCKFQEYIQK